MILIPTFHPTMAPFSVSSLKEKASQVKTAGIKSYGSARERLSTTGTPSTATATGKAKPPPPPPPAHRRASSSTSSFNRRSSLASQVSATPSGTTDVDKIDWSNLSYEDKQAFFAWLDEFFARYLDEPPPTNAPTAPTFTRSPGNNTPAPSPSPRPSPSVPPRRLSSRASQNTGPDTQDEVAPVLAAPAPGRRNLPPVMSQQGPPKINFSTKPSAPAEILPTPMHSHSADPTVDLQMSFPPPAVNGSAAADLAVFMHPSTPWDNNEWYASSSPIPPHLNGSPHTRFAGSFGYSDPRVKTARGVILFSDLSICWYSVTYGTGPASVTRWARFRPRPEPLPGAVLQQAAETYGAAVAAFAEHAVAGGRPVGRGECWDVAHEGLLHAQSVFGDAPVLSTSRAHGHLLFCGKPGVGRWRGGDDRFRTGDIVEWRSVRIGTGQYGSFALLGDPDHTAVLVEDTVPRCAVADGRDVRPADIGVLTVVEQSAGHAPKRDSYDLANLQQGEVWVYRPIGMVTYLGSTLSIDIPSGLEISAV